MTVDRGVIFWITILFIMVSPTRSSLEGEPGSVCFSKIKSVKPVNVSYVETFKVDASSLLCWGCVDIRSRTTYKTVHQNVALTKFTCCQGYENKNGTCKPKCSSTCPNGYCTQPNICACNSGWTGDLCNVPTLCSVCLQSSEAMSEIRGLANIRNESKDRSEDRMWPACHSKCRDQFCTNTTVNMTLHDDHLIPINSSCNIADSFAWKKYCLLIGVIIGITLSGVVAYVVYIVWKRKKIKSKTTDEPVQIALSNYMEENEIYSFSK